MSIKKAGGVFGRNPTFNDVTIEGDITVDGTAIPDPSTILVDADIGTIASQDADSVNIDGGSIDGVTIGGESAGAATVTSLDVSDGNITNVGTISVDTVNGDGDSDTSINFEGSDVLTFDVGGQEASQFDASRNFYVGTSSPGSASNAQRVTGGIFTTLFGSTSPLDTGVAATLFTLPGGSASQTWIVSSDMQGEATVAFQAVYLLVYTNSGTVSVTQLQKGSLASISMSGLNVQYTQSSGGNGKTNNRWSAIRIF